MSSVVSRLGIAHGAMLRSRAATGVDVAELVRGYVQVTDMARRVAERLPARDPALIVHRVDAIASDLGRRPGQTWPGDGPRAESLRLVHDQLRLAAQDAPDVPPAGVDAAHRQLAGLLWVGAHDVGERARIHAIDLRIDRVPGSELEQAAANDVASRLRAIAGLAHEGTLLESQRAGVPLQRDIARWGLAAHRTIAAERTTMSMHYISQIEHTLATDMSLLLRQARDLGVVDDLTVERLDPGLRNAADAWDSVAKQTYELGFSSFQPDPRLIALSDQIGDSVTALHAEQVPDEHRAALRAIAAHSVTSMGLASQLKDTALEPELRAPAKSIVRMLREDPNIDDRVTASLAPDAAAGRTTVIPAEARDQLQESVGMAYTAAQEVVHRTAALDPLLRDDTLTPAPSLPDRDITPALDQAHFPAYDQPPWTPDQPIR